MNGDSNAIKHPKRQIVHHMEDLPQNVRELCRHSLDARKSSYSPYSQFAVGAALLTTDGKVIKGINAF